MARARDFLYRSGTLYSSRFGVTVLSRRRFGLTRSSNLSKAYRLIENSRPYTWHRFAAGACSAQAGPPFVTDDPEPPPPGGWEINIPFILERTPGKTEMDSPLFDLNYGLPNVQLKLEIPISALHDDGDGTRAGGGDLLVGVKWRFLTQEQWKF